MRGEGGEGGEGEKGRVGKEGGEGEEGGVGWETKLNNLFLFIGGPEKGQLFVEKLYFRASMGAFSDVPGSADVPGWARVGLGGPGWAPSLPSPASQGGGGRSRSKLASK